MLSPRNRPEVIITKSLRNFFLDTNEPILLFSIIDGNRDKINNFRKKIVEEFNVNVTKIDVFGVPQSFKEKGEDYPNPYAIEIMAKDITKAKAIKELTDYLNINLSETIAFGDGRNDIEMFKIVDYKIAMENAVPELKDMADMITKSNNKSGVAEALNKIFLRSEGKMKIIVTVCIRDNDKFLIVQEGIPKAYGLWNLPGGHLEEGEGLVEGALREAKEETGLDIKINGILSIQRNIKEESNILRVVFNAIPISEDIEFDKDEILDVRWISIKEAENMDTKLLRQKDLFLDNIQDIKNNKNYPLEMIKNFK